MRGHAAVVLPAIEFALQILPDRVAFRDTRGLARALTGDRAGALEDFEAFVASNELRYKEEQVERSRWIAELRAGRNPFDSATLARLASP